MKILPIELMVIVVEQIHTLFFLKKISPYWYQYNTGTEKKNNNKRIKN